MSARKIFFTAASVALGALSLNAGQIQIGGTTGLTTAYMTNGCQGASVAQNGANYVGCVTPSTGTWSKVNTVGNAYATGTTGVTWSGTPLSAGNPDPSLSHTNTLATDIVTTTAAPLASNGVTFSLIDDNATQAKVWAGSTTANTTSTIIIPVGIFGVDKAWTMLNDEWGWSGDQSVTVTYNFGATSTDTSSGSVVNAGYTLTNGNQIRDVDGCTASTGAGSQYPTPCTQFATATTSANTFKVFSGGYTDNTTSASAYYKTSGSLSFDGQAFDLSAYSSLYLVSVTITDSTGATIGGGINHSRAILSALTVDQVSQGQGGGQTPTPEPSTFALLFAGAGFVGYKKFRRA